MPSKRTKGQTPKVPLLARRSTARNGAAVAATDVTAQVIVGFEPTAFAKSGFGLARKGVGSLLGNLSDFGLKTLRIFVASPVDGGPVYAAALVQLNSPDFTLRQFRKAIKAGEKIVSGIRYAERNAVVTLAGFNDHRAKEQWALGRLGVEGDWPMKPPPWPPSPAKLTVAIVDSGLRRPDGTVPSDIGTVLPRTVCQPLGTPFSDGIDRDGHGTLLAGNIAAVPNNNEGIASPIPGDWNISLMPIKFFGPEAPPTMFDAATAIIHAVAQGAKIINASWHVAVTKGDREIVRDAMRQAKDAQCLVVAAAGNDGSDNDFYPTFPANFKQLTVLSVMATGRDDHKTAFSNYGKTTVDIAAPGLRILTTGRYLTDEPRYQTYSGTSASAAFVSSGAALLLALNPRWRFKELREHLLESADVVEALKIACVDGKRLNLKRAVFGPIKIIAPAQGDVLRVGSPTRVTWSLDYDNKFFKKVKIQFSMDDGATYLDPPLDDQTNIGAGRFRWVPQIADRTNTGRLRITPLMKDIDDPTKFMEANFPVVSASFRVA
jgi:hypothetical protein